MDDSNDLSPWLYTAMLTGSGGDLGDLRAAGGSAGARPAPELRGLRRHPLGDGLGDNPKTVVQARQGDLIVWNAVFGQVALDYRFAPELCWPRAAPQKGAVEQLVGWGSSAASLPVGASTIVPTSSASSPAG
jgi:hypothetical protein